MLCNRGVALRARMYVPLTDAAAPGPQNSVGAYAAPASVLPTSRTRRLLLPTRA